MYGGEDFRIFDANRGQVVDVEKSSIVDLVHRDPPEAEAIRLTVQQAFQPVKASRIPSLTVHFFERLANRNLRLRTGRDQCSEPSLHDLLLALALVNFRFVGLGGVRQMAQGGDDALQLRNILMLRREESAQLGRRRLEDHGPGARSEWKRDFIER